MTEIAIWPPHYRIGDIFAEPRARGEENIIISSRSGGSVLNNKRRQHKFHFIFPFSAQSTLLSGGDFRVLHLLLLMMMAWQAKVPLPPLRHRGEKIRRRKKLHVTGHEEYWIIIYFVEAYDSRFIICLHSISSRWGGEWMEHPRD
jgi:hypothetical protein